MLARKNRHYGDANLKDVRKVFNNGVCFLYEADERVLTKRKGKFFFSKESIGIGHYWEAFNNNISIDMAIGIVSNDLIDTQDIVKIDDEFYRIVNIQYKNNLNPNWMKISLQRSVMPYEDETE